MTPNVPYLPGMEPPPPAVSVRPAYELALERLRADGSIGDEHAGICASVLALATIADDTHTKAYARNDALKEAHEQMKTLLEAARARGDAEFQAFAARMQA